VGCVWVVWVELCVSLCAEGRRWMSGLAASATGGPVGAGIGASGKFSRAMRMRGASSVLQKKNGCWGKQSLGSARRSASVGRRPAPTPGVGGVGWPSASQGAACPGRGSRGSAWCPGRRRPRWRAGPLGPSVAIGGGRGLADLPPQGTHALPPPPVGVGPCNVQPNRPLRGHCKGEM